MRFSLVFKCKRVHIYGDIESFVSAIKPAQLVSQSSFSRAFDGRTTDLLLSRKKTMHNLHLFGRVCKRERTDRCAIFISIWRTECMHSILWPVLRSPTTPPNQAVGERMGRNSVHGKLWAISTHFSFEHRFGKYSCALCITFIVFLSLFSSVVSVFIVLLRIRSHGSLAETDRKKQ